MNGQKSGSTNVVLMALVGLLVGFIAGYVVGQKNVPPAAQSAQAGVNTPVFCPHQLDAKDQWIIAGFRCPGTDTTQVPLLGCHCVTAHAIEDRVRSELTAGKSGQAVRDELLAEFGTRLSYR